MAPEGHLSAGALAALLGGSAVTHFVAPRPYDAIVPRALPGTPRFWTYASAVAELSVAALVAVPRTRAVGGLAAAVLFAAVFPANVKMAYDWRHRPAVERAIAYARLPLQAPLIWWALRVARLPVTLRGGPDPGDGKAPSPRAVPARARDPNRPAAGRRPHAPLSHDHARRHAAARTRRPVPAARSAPGRQPQGHTQPTAMPAGQTAAPGPALAPDLSWPARRRP